MRRTESARRTEKGGFLLLRALEGRIAIRTQAGRSAHLADRGRRVARVRDFTAARSRAATSAAHAAAARARRARSEARRRRARPPRRRDHFETSGFAADGGITAADRGAAVRSEARGGASQRARGSRAVRRARRADARRDARVTSVRVLRLGGAQILARAGRVRVEEKTHLCERSLSLSLSQSRKRSPFSLSL